MSAGIYFKTSNNIRKWPWVNQQLYVLIVQVDLYEVLDSRVKPWRGNLITSRLVPLYTHGWEVFNVTQMVTPSLCFVSLVISTPSWVNVSWWERVDKTFNLFYHAPNVRCQSGSSTARRITASWWWPRFPLATGWSHWPTRTPTWQYSQTTGGREHQTSHTWVRRQLWCERVT